MKLYGMLDSPYVRRVAVSLQLLGLPFEHEPLSVFGGFAEFREVNPVVKAPTLACGDGTVLMDSTLILAYAEALARPRTLMPTSLQLLQQDLRLTGLALAALEKTVQLVYEDGLRPPEKRHEPWVIRVTGQLRAAYSELEGSMDPLAGPVASRAIRQSGVTAAVAWHFTQAMLPSLVPAAACPRLAAFSKAAEALPEFRAAPHGPGRCRAAG